jgi:hypothetical protein
MVVTVEQAREKLGKNAEKMSDQEIEKLLNLMRIICNKVIDSVVENKDSN